MKKEWIKPELKDLNLENTYDDALENCPGYGDDLMTLNCPPFNGNGNGAGNKKCKYPGCNHKVKGNDELCKCHPNFEISQS